MEYKSLFSCGVCQEVYSDRESKTPRNFKCGHSVCSECIGKIIPRGKHCPECREKFEEDSFHKLPVNSPILRMAKLYAYEKTDTESFPPLTFPLNVPSLEKKDAGQCPKHEGCNLFFMCMPCKSFVCRQCLVEDHPDPPRGRCYIMDLEEGINRIKENHIKSLDKHTEKLNTFISGHQRNIRVLAQMLKYNSNSGTLRCALVSSTIDFLKNEMETSDQNLLNFKPFLDSLKDVKDSLTNTTSPHELLEVTKESSNRQMAFENYEKDLSLDYTTDVLQSKTICAILEEDGEEEEGTTKIRWAPVCFKGSHILLYSLRDGPPPQEEVNFFPYDCLRKLVNLHHPRVFMDILWKGEPKGCVYVQLFDDTPRARQTLYLCTGEKGPSYRNTCFYKVDKVNDTDSICGGDYENNDGSGGRSIVDGIDDGPLYQHEIKSGLFASFPSQDEWRLASFDIYLKGKTGEKDNSAHGIVDEGLDILREASNTPPVTDFSVVDCGVVLSDYSAQK